MNKKSKKLVMTGKLEKFDFGGYVQNPAVDLTENQIALVSAKNKAANNPWAMGTKLFGNLAMQYGMSKMSQGAGQGQGVSNGGFNWGQLLQGGIGSLGALGNSFATGGTVGVPTPINAEGEEVIETPQGEVRELKGPSHSEGGIDMVVPSGTEIFSKKLKGQDGKTMAERKLDRENKINKLQKQLDKNPGDVTLQRTLKRVQSNNEKVEADDMSVMQFAKMVSEAQKFATGGVAGWPPMNMDWNNILKTINPNMTGTTDDYHTGDNTLDYPMSNGQPVTNQYPSFANNWNNGEVPTTTYNPNATNPINPVTPTNNDSILPNVTAGDAVGLFGDLVSTFGPMRNTRNQRATDTPNINPYLNYGKDGLERLDQSKGFAAGVRDSQLKDLELARQTTSKRTRNGARSINTMRALDLATDANINNSRESIYNNYMQQIASILSQQAGLENDQDRMVMTGEAQRDQNDRADRDAYFSAMATDIATQGTGLQKIGKDLNQIKTRNTTGNVLNQMYPNFEVDMMSGKISGKVTEEQVKGTTIYNNLGSKQLKDKYLKGVTSKNYKWSDGKLYNKQGKELDLTTLEPIV